MKDNYDEEDKMEELKNQRRERGRRVKRRRRLGKNCKESHDGKCARAYDDASVRGV